MCSEFCPDGLTIGVSMKQNLKIGKRYEEMLVLYFFKAYIYDSWRGLVSPTGIGGGANFPGTFHRLASYDYDAPSMNPVK